MNRATRIHGISDIYRMPRAGKIRLGIKQVSQKTGKEYPRETSYFVVPPEIEEEYGPQPTELKIMLPVNDREKVFPHSYKWYGSSMGVKCSGDGETAWRLNEKTFEREEIPCPCEKLDSGECGIRAHLMVMVLGSKLNLGVAYQIDMGSYNSVVDINSGITHVEQLLGYFAMVPLVLKRIPRETHHDGKKQTHYTLHIHLPDEFNIETINRLREDRQRILSMPQYRLEAPKDDNPRLDPPDEVIDVTDEENEPAPGPQTPPEQDLSAEVQKLKDASDKRKEKMTGEWQTPAHRKLEQLLKKEMVGREDFKQFLCEQELLPPDDSGGLHMGNLSSENAADVVNKWEQRYQEYRMWATKQREPGNGDE